MWGLCTAVWYGYVCPWAKRFAIRLFVIDDFCPEAFAVLKLSLFLPGGDILIGKDYTSYVVIEDDDEIAGRVKNKAYCKRQGRRFIQKSNKIIIHQYCICIIKSIKISSVNGTGYILIFYFHAF